MKSRWVNQRKRARVLPRPSIKDPRPYLTCKKCGHVIIMTCIDRHLETCQPNGTMCPICREHIKPIGYVQHLQTCYKEALAITAEYAGITW